MGDNWYAQAIYKNFCVHCLYTKKIKPIGEHEDTHLLSIKIGNPVGFLQEGLAEYLVGHDWYGKNHNVRARIGLKKKIFPKFKSMLSHKAWLDSDDKYAVYFYCYAGSFVKFLINKFSKKKFLRLYKLASRENNASKNAKIFKGIYGVSVNDVEDLWKRSLI